MITHSWKNSHIQLEGRLDKLNMTQLKQTLKTGSDTSKVSRQATHIWHIFVVYRLGLHRQVCTGTEVYCQ